MKNAQGYIDSLRHLNKKVYYFGERIENWVDSPLIRPHINAVAMTYELAHDPQYEDLMTASSHLTGERINRFTHMAQGPEDMVKKSRMERLMGQKTATCFQRCAGWDALGVVYMLTAEIDQAKGTGYHERAREFIRHVQREDLQCAAGMTDPKGDRSLPPSRQADPDLFMRIVDQRSDGLVVRGAKAHQTGGVNAHELVVVPTTALGEADRDYAVAFAIPADSAGLTYIFGRQSNDTRRLEPGEIDRGNATFGSVGGESLIIFNDVFVPWERVFMCREYEFAGPLVERFACIHRQTYACKTGVGDVLIGATALMADYLGLSKVSHIRDKIGEMVHMNETVYSCSVAAGLESYRTVSGAYAPSNLLAHTVKLNLTRFSYEMARLAHDIAGGIIATMPSEQDLRHPELGPIIAKYLQGACGVGTEEKARLLRLIEAMTGTTTLAEYMHGAGPPQAQKVMLLRQANLEHKKRLAKEIAGIKT